jgi:hypothetical protein
VAACIKLIFVSQNGHRDDRNLDTDGSISIVPSSMYEVNDQGHWCYPRLRPSAKLQMVRSQPLAEFISDTSPQSDCASARHNVPRADIVRARARTMAIAPRYHHHPPPPSTESGSWYRDHSKALHSQKTYRSHQAVPPPKFSATPWAMSRDALRMLGVRSPKSGTSGSGLPRLRTHSQTKLHLPRVPRPRPSTRLSISTSPGKYYAMCTFALH